MKQFRRGRVRKTPKNPPSAGVTGFPHDGGAQRGTAMDDGRTTQPILGPALSTIKALAWPATILFVAIAFWTPIHRLVDRFSPLVDNISSVTVGGVQFTVGKEFIEKRAPEAVRTAVAKLSPQAVRYLLENERGINHPESHPTATRSPFPAATGSGHPSLPSSLC
jgi:hypothetical protein